MHAVCRAVDCGGSKISSTIVVDQSNKANFRTIQAAIDSIKPNNAQWVKIQINAGVYKEKVQIPTEKPCIFLQGQGKQVTTITNNDHNAPNTSSTFTAFANNLAASEITFKNSYGIIQRLNMHRNERHFGIRDPSLAARISGDKCAFYNCNFIGFQDTVWDERGRHYFQNCLFEGAVDFIFGAGQSFYQDCVLNATALGSITAQGRASTSDQSGFVFEGGSVVGSGVGNSLLGRAYRSCSRVIFHKTALAPVVEPVGWDAWNYTNKISEDCKQIYAESAFSSLRLSVQDQVRTLRNVLLGRRN
ncbi:unnamed protein product [Sphenostylis stenocarpa]|uniref:pectinesterase n=1 Tax=Sphenostylis stenocarpa TaxID=92480 RepID=A0AA87BA60_9FABA|nr:unnamed protein product [Sphenostylis stenocarpa]